MTLSLLSPPITEPVLLDDIKHHLRVSDDNDDISLAGLSVAARHALEARAGLAFMPQQWRYSPERFGLHDLILPLTPVISVDNINLSQADGTEIEVSLDTVRIDTGSVGRICLKNLKSSTLKPFGNSYGKLSVVFTAGYQAVESIPAELRHAIRLLTAHFYENRESAGEARVFTIPRTIDTLVAPYRRVSI